MVFDNFCISSIINLYFKGKIIRQRNSNLSNTVFNTYFPVSSKVIIHFEGEIIRPIPFFIFQYGFRYVLLHLVEGQNNNPLHNLFQIFRINKIFDEFSIFYFVEGKLNLKSKTIRPLDLRYVAKRSIDTFLHFHGSFLEAK